MPSTSKKQHKFMQAVAHSEKFAKKVGVPMSVGKDFVEADKGRKFGTGGSTGVTYGGQGQINKQRTRFGSKFGYKLNVPDESLNKYVGKKEGGSVKTFRKGGSVNSAVAAINKQQTHHGQMQLPNVSLNKYAMKKKEGGMATMKHDDVKQDKAMIKKAVGMHDKQLHGGKKTNLSALKTGGRIASKGEHEIQKQSKRGAEIVKMAKGGLAAGHKSADGIAVRGKTRAMAPAMCGGGSAKMRKGGKVC